MQDPGFEPQTQQKKKQKKRQMEEITMATKIRAVEKALNWKISYWVRPHIKHHISWSFKWICIRPHPHICCSMDGSYWGPTQISNILQQQKNWWNFFVQINNLFGNFFFRQKIAWFESACQAFNRTFKSYHTRNIKKRISAKWFKSGYPWFESTFHLCYHALFK